MDRRIELIISKIKTDPIRVGFCCARRAGESLAFALSTSLQTGNGNNSGSVSERVRLRRAAKLLRNTFLTIKQILKQVGLGSNAHFVRDFRQLYGMTPTAYRRTDQPQSQTTRRRKKKRSATPAKFSRFRQQTVIDYSPAILDCGLPTKLSKSLNGVLKMFFQSSRGINFVRSIIWSNSCLLFLLLGAPAPGQTPETVLARVNDKEITSEAGGRFGRGANLSVATTALRDPESRAREPHHHEDSRERSSRREAFPSKSFANN